MAVAIAALAGGRDNVNVYYHVDINSYLDTGVNPIGPGAPFHVAEDPNADNLIYESQVRAKIEKLLVAKGYRIADADSADYWLAFKYGATSGSGVNTGLRQDGFGEASREFRQAAGRAGCTVHIKAG